VRCKDQTTFDNNLGRLRPSSQLFQDGTDALGDTDPVSAYVAAECGTPQVALRGYEEGWGLVMLTEAFVTSLGLRIVNKPDPNGPPGHVVLVGRKTGSVRSKLAKEASWVVPC